MPLNNAKHANDKTLLDRKRRKEGQTEEGSIYQNDCCKHAKTLADESDSNLYARTCHLDLFCICILFATHKTITITNRSKKMQEEMARRPKGNSVKLMLIRPSQLQFFKDGIKITETGTKYYKMEIKIINIKGVYKMLKIKQLLPKIFARVY